MKTYKNFKTEQEALWASEFFEDYSLFNQSEVLTPF